MKLILGLRSCDRSDLVLLVEGRPSTGLLNVYGQAEVGVPKQVILERREDLRDDLNDQLRRRRLHQ